MKGQSARPKSLTNKIIWIGIGMGVLFWVFESLFHGFFMHESNFIAQVLSPDLHEFYYRFLVLSLIIALSVFAQFTINKQRKAEETIRLAYAELDQIFNTSADGMRVIDKDFNVIRINETLLGLLDLSLDEVLGKKCYETFWGPKCHTPDCTLTRIIDGEELVKYEVEKEHKGGRMTCSLTATSFRAYTGELIGTVEDFRDITEEKQAEDALRQSEEQYRLLVENANDAIFIIQDGVIKFSNPRTEEMTGYSATELDGIPFINFIHPEDRKIVLESRRRRLKGEDPPSTYSFRVLNRSGEQLWVACWSP